MTVKKLFSRGRIACAVATLALVALVIAVLTEVTYADLRHAMKLEPPVPPDIRVGTLYAVGLNGRIPRDARPVCRFPSNWRDGGVDQYFDTIGPYEYALKNWLGASLPKVVSLMDFLSDGSADGATADDEVLPTAHYQIALRLSAKELVSESASRELVMVAGQMIAAQPGCETFIREKWRNEQLCVVMIDRLVRTESGRPIGFSFHPQCIVPEMPDGDYSHGPLVAPEAARGFTEVLAHMKGSMSLVELALDELTTAQR